jgi:hypothetical protein
MKKSIKKLQFSKNTIVRLNGTVQENLNGGATVTCTTTTVVSRADCTFGTRCVGCVWQY